VDSLVEFSLIPTLRFCGNGGVQGEGYGIG